MTGTTLEVTDIGSDADIIGMMLSPRWRRRILKKWAATR